MTDGPLVIDASVLAKIYLRDEEFSRVAEALVRGHSTGARQLVAPDLIQYEIARAIQAAVRKRRLDPIDGRRAVRQFFALRIQTLGSTERSRRPLIESAYLRAEQLGCRLNDAVYVVMAEVLGYEFITADRKLHTAISSQVDLVVWIGDYPIDETSS